MASERDLLVGQNVARFREAKGLSQKDLAEVMREQGFRWSQATVWSVEKGERPLRLTEAETLEPVLGVFADALLRPADPANEDLRSAIKAVVKSLGELRSLTGTLHQNLSWLRAEAGALLADGISISRSNVDSLRWLLADDVIEAAVKAGHRDWGRTLVAGSDGLVRDSGSTDFEDDPLREEILETLADLEKERLRVASELSRSYPDGEHPETR